MKLNVNLIISALIFTLLLSFSSTSAAPGKAFNRIDMLKIEKFKRQLNNQEPILKERIEQKKIKGLANRFPVGNLNVKNFNAGTLKEQVKEGTGSIKLMVNTSKDKNILSDELKKYDARIIRMRKNTAVIEVPTENLEKLFNEVKSIENARLPLRFYPQAVESEGVAVTNSDDFHNLAYYGTGVKIAVIDVGFKGLTEAVANGDLPGDILTRAIDYSGNGLETEYYHGTACAEIIYDMAPQAELYLFKIQYTTDIQYAIDYCIANSIEIMSCSIGTTGTGPGDGTGPLDEAFDEARANGILAVAAAGNNGVTTYDNGVILGAHWKGMFRDTDADNYHEFVAGNGDVVSFNLFAAYPDTNDDGEPEDGEVSVLLRWNDYINANIDYDMFLYEYDYDTGDVEEIASSTYTQDGSSYEPAEYISVNIDNSENYLHYYAIRIVKSGGVQNAEMELHLGGTSMFLPYDENTGPIATSASSIIEPADAESVLAVGVIGYTDWLTGPQEDYSSQGPTNAWAGSAARIKPDVMGPDGVSTFTYSDPLSDDDGFYGASAATPHVAGLAALILSKYPDMTTDELQEAIESKAIDMGTTGRDNIYGWGRINAETDLDDIVIPHPSGGGGGGGCFIDTAESGSSTGTCVTLFIIAIISLLVVIKTCAGRKKLSLRKTR